MYPRKKENAGCNCPKCKRENAGKHNDIFAGELLSESSLQQRGLNDLVQDTGSRGYVPYQNQPDHVANFWKCDYSHARQQEGAGCLDTVFASDYPTPLRGAAVNQDVGGVSNMHLISRFAAVRS